ncbi:hypothetical protein BH23CHL5_BH23CHL5_08560 [soil metagenome]
MTAKPELEDKASNDRRFQLYFTLDRLEELLEDMVEAGVHSQDEIVERIEAINRELDELEQDS